MKSAFTKPTASSESGESDSETDTKVSPIITMSASATSVKPKNVGFFKKADSDSENEDSDHEDEVVPNTKLTSSKMLASNSQDLDASDAASEVSDAVSNTLSDTKSLSNLMTSNDPFKTRKALKSEQRLKERKDQKDQKRKSSKSTEEEIDDCTSTSVLDGFRNQQDMEPDYVFDKIHIRCCQRNSRKTITTIEGIQPSFFDEANRPILKNLMTALKNGTRATHKFDDETSTNIIEISGNKIENMIQALTKHVGCERSNIVVHGVQ